MSATADELLLAIDAGTGSARAVLFDLEGAEVGLGQREYSHRTDPAIPGSQIFDTGANWSLICECVREALGEVDPGRVAAVSATSMREGMVLYDAAGNEIWACPNVDSRAGAEVSELVASGAARRIYEEAGDWVAITDPARFRWIARHEPETFAAIAHVGMLGDWILRRLSGEFVTDPSLGSSSGMFYLGGRRWSEEIIEIAGVPASAFPPVVESGTAIGAVSAEAAAECGLRAGTPVVAGGADTQLALLGLGDTEPGRFTLVGGTFWQHTVVLDRPLIDPEGRLRTLCHTVPGRWMIEGIGFYCGLVSRWFRDAFCGAEVEEAAARGVDPYVVLEEAAAAVPAGSNGVFGLFSNLMQADRWVHGPSGFLGVDVADPVASGRPALFRAIEESAAYVARGHLEIAEEVAGLEVADTVLTGGAAKGTLWPQICADVLDRPVRVPRVKESTALGAAIYAGTGVGLFADPGETARRLASFERTFEPEPEAAIAYREIYERWRELYRRTQASAEAGLVRPLWRAAGT